MYRHYGRIATFLSITYLIKANKFCTITWLYRENDVDIAQSTACRSRLTYNVNNWTARSVHVFQTSTNQAILLQQRYIAAVLINCSCRSIFEDLTKGAAACHPKGFRGIYVAKSSKKSEHFAGRSVIGELHKERDKRVNIMAFGISIILLEATHIYRKWISTAGWMEHIEDSSLISSYCCIRRGKRKPCRFVRGGNSDRVNLRYSLQLYILLMPDLINSYSLWSISYAIPESHECSMRGTITKLFIMANI